MSHGNLERRSVLLLHPTGNAFVRQAALALHQAGMLAAFHTTIAWRPGSVLDRFVPGRVRTELARRSYSGIPAELIHTHPWNEMMRLIAQRREWHRLIRHETGRFSMDAVCAALDRAVAHALTRGPVTSAVYGYDDCAEETFTAAKRLGIRCVYELPIGHYRVYQQIVEEEHTLRPEWACTLTGIRDSPEKGPGNCARRVDSCGQFIYRKDAQYLSRPTDFAHKPGPLWGTAGGSGAPAYASRGRSPRTVCGVDRSTQGNQLPF